MGADSGVAAVAALCWLESLGRGAQPGDRSHRHEALAMLVHALLIRHGFRSEGVEEGATEDKLPVAWSEGGYGGRYRHGGSSMTFEVRSMPVGGKLMTTGVALEEENKVYSLELKLDDMVAKDVDQSASAKWDGVFTNLPAIATLVQINIAHKLVPDSAKDGYQETVESERHSTEQTRAPPPRRVVEDPYGRPPHPLYNEDFDDPLRVGPPRRPGMVGIPGGMEPQFPGMPQVGHGDLMPGGLPDFGRMPGNGPSFGQGNLLGPQNFRPNLGGGLGPQGLRGGPRGGLPPGVPPGARFDPYMPPGTGGMPGVPGRGEFGNGSGAPHPDIEPPGPPPDNMYW